VEIAVGKEQYVRCEWDPDARVWVVTSDDVPGLATGADTLDQLIEKLKVVRPAGSQRASGTRSAGP
jgi:Domain of unknown function (DUF1902)